MLSVDDDGELPPEPMVVSTSERSKQCCVDVGSIACRHCAIVRNWQRGPPVGLLRQIRPLLVLVWAAAAGWTARTATLSAAAAMVARMVAPHEMTNVRVHETRTPFQWFPEIKIVPGGTLK